MSIVRYYVKTYGELTTKKKKDKDVPDIRSYLIDSGTIQNLYLAVSYRWIRLARVPIANKDAFSVLIALEDDKQASSAASLKSKILENTPFDHQETLLRCYHKRKVDARETRTNFGESLNDVFHKVFIDIINVV